jgi:hypothetical protein
LYHPACGRSGVNKIVVLLIGFVLGGVVVGGLMLLSDNQDESTSGPIDHPEASPTTTAAVPTPVTEADELRIDGLGSMTIGMHVDDVERATGMEVDVSSDFSPQCRYGQLVGGPRDLFLMFSRRELVRIDVGSDGDPNGYRDRSGGSHLGSRRRLRR